MPLEKAINVERRRLRLRLVKYRPAAGGAAAALHSRQVHEMGYSIPYQAFIESK